MTGLTWDEIRALPAGRELDALVAERVMGWVWHRDLPFPTGGSGWATPDGRPVAGMDWSPSTDIAAAWDVLRELCLPWTIAQDPCGWSRVTLSVMGKDANGEDDWVDVSTTCENHQVPLGICRAALLTKREAQQSH